MSRSGSCDLLGGKSNCGRGETSTLAVGAPAPGGVGVFSGSSSGPPLIGRISRGFNSSLGASFGMSIFSVITILGGFAPTACGVGSGGTGIGIVVSCFLVIGSSSVIPCNFLKLTLTFWKISRLTSSAIFFATSLSTPSFCARSGIKSLGCRTPNKTKPVSSARMPIFLI